jgi:hypothetical protein
MALGLKKDFLGFEILPTTNPKVLLWLDTSSYKDPQPERPLMEVTLPGHSKYYLVNIIAKKINVLNSTIIGTTTSLSSFADLPDGVWTLKYKICPYQYVYLQRYHLRTVHLECQLRQLYLKLEETECDVRSAEQINRELTDIHVIIESAKAHAEEDRPKIASSKYAIALKKVNKLLDKISGICS